MERSPEKSKDFKGSIIRLFNSLNNWKYLLVFALILGFVSAILALITPNNKLKKDNIIMNKIFGNLIAIKEDKR